MKSILKNIVVKILIIISKMILNKHKPFIIGVTGNVGKTSTKDSIYGVFLENVDKRIIRRSDKSMNSETGVPLTIIGKHSAWSNPLGWIYIFLYGIYVIYKKDYPKYLILEIGADKKDDIKDICDYIKLDIGVVTAFAKYPVHLENFSNRDELIREKRYLIEAIKNGGALIYNSGCIDTAKMIQEAYSEDTMNKSITKYSYGIEIGDVFVRNIINNINDKNVECRLFIKHINTTDNNFVADYNIVLNGVLGEAAILTSLPGLIIAQLLGFDIQRSILAMKDMKRPPGRMRVFDGQYGTTLIDDSYNSSPVAVQNGLNVLSEIKNRDRYTNIIVVLGDMMELGEMSPNAHSEIGELVGKTYIDKLITVGIRSREIRLSAIRNGILEKNTLEYANSIEAGRNIINMLSEGILPVGSIVYIKGSQSVRMERITKMLLNKGLDPADYLPRQEKAWLKR